MRNENYFPKSYANATNPSPEPLESIEMADRETIGRRIRDAREDLEWSKLMLANVANISSHSQVCRIEDGSRGANIETIWAVARALGMSMEELLRP